MESKKYWKIFVKNFPDYIIKKISDVNFYYKGIHNITLKALYNQKFHVQIRIPISEISNKKIEEIFIKNTEGILYYRDGFLVRKWIEGTNLVNKKLNFLEQKKFLQNLDKFYIKLNNSFQEKKNNLKLNFNWLDNFITDKKYFRILEEISFDNIFFIHGDINKKNVIIDKNKNYHFIDLEYIRKNNLCYDIASLVEKLNFSKKIVCNHYQISKEKLEKFIYIFKKYNYYWIKNLKLNSIKDQEKSKEKFIINIKKTPKELLNFLEQNFFSELNFFKKNNKILIKIYHFVSDFFQKQKIKKNLESVKKEMIKLESFKVKKNTKIKNFFEEILKLEKNKNNFLTLEHKLFIYKIAKKNVKKSLFYADFSLSSFGKNTDSTSNFINWTKFDFEKFFIGNKYLNYASFSVLNDLNEKNERIFLDFLDKKINFKHYQEMKIVFIYYLILKNTNEEKKFKNSKNKTLVPRFFNTLYKYLK